MTELTGKTIQRLPKVVLNDHLIGGVRPSTLIALAREAERALPAEEPDQLAQWFRDTAPTSSIEEYLARQEPVIDLTQTTEALSRVAREAVLDLAVDGVVYAEIRFAPEQHTRQGLCLAEATQAVLEGLRVGMAQARFRGGEITARVILTAMRESAEAMEIADLALRQRDAGVVGFDVAGPERGDRPSRHIAACERIRQENFHLTLHAGQDFGLASIAEAVHWCGAHRLGHGVRIAEDIVRDADGDKLGQLSAYIRDQRIPLELCPTTNVHMGVVDTLSDHPIDLLRRLRFRVTVNPGNRLLSDTSMTGEFEALCHTFGYTLDDLSWFTVNAMKSAFLPHDERLSLINHIIKPGYARERVDQVRGALFRREDLW